MIALAACAFFAGRWTAEAPRAGEPVDETVEIAEAPEDVEEIAAAAVTSTAGLCPCPPRRKPSPKRRAIVRRAPPPVELPPPPQQDRSAATARYLKESAGRFAACAPAGGEKIRVHVEIGVSPSGAIEAFRIANLEPVPKGVAACVEGVARGLSPPGFDASEGELFALTLVL